MTNGYDLIGDIHGHADLLVQLLAKLGYRERAGAWRHEERQVIFVGDFVDRGPKQLKTLKIVRRMVDAGSALTVMGNHEFNAIAWYLPDPAKPGEYLRSRFDPKHGPAHRRQHAAFLAEVGDNDKLHRELIEWFLTLPLWLDLPQLRVVHACWHPRLMEYIAPKLTPARCLSEALMAEASRKPANEADLDTPTPSVYKAIEAILKGIELPLPKWCVYLDKEGIERDRVRARWWDPQAVTYQTAAIIEESLRERLPDLPTPEASRIAPPTDKPMFIGHYWLTGRPIPLSANLACLDLSAGRGGPLCAYRWEGEALLDPEHFLTVFS
jgi:hypothetical protein